MLLKHYIGFYNSDGKEKLPYYLNGEITTVRVKKFQDITFRDIGTLEEYYKCVDEGFSLFPELFFITSETNIYLDYYPLGGYFLASEKCLQLLLNHISYEEFGYRELTFIQQNKRPLQSSLKYFVYEKNKSSVLDVSKMEIGKYIPEFDGNNEVQTLPNGVVSPVRAFNLVFKDVGRDLFSASDVPMARASNYWHFFSERLKNLFVEHKIIGPLFIPVDDLAIIDFRFDGTQYNLVKPNIHIRKNLSLWKAPVIRKDFYDRETAPIDPEIAALLATVKIKK